MATPAAFAVIVPSLATSAYSPPAVIAYVTALSVALAGLYVIVVLPVWPGCKETFVNAMLCKFTALALGLSYVIVNASQNNEFVEAAIVNTTWSLYPITYELLEIEGLIFT